MSTPQNGLYDTFVMQKVISVKTNAKRELLDITSEVEEIISKSKVDEGVVLVFVKHTTCALIISEMENDLEKDILDFFEKEGPQGPFSHSHGDFLAHDPKHAGKSHTSAHILSATTGQSLTIPVKDGKMTLGTWQRICLAEFDGPRNREIVISVLK